MPSFRDIPETLRPLARPERDEPPHRTRMTCLPSRRWSTAASMWTACDCPGLLPTQRPGRRWASCSWPDKKPSPGSACTSPPSTRCKKSAIVFGLHPLAVEDAVQAHQRPKLERYDETLFLVLKTVNYVPHESVVLTREIVETGEIMIFVNGDFVVTVRHGEHGRLSDVRKRMDADPEHMPLGPFAVMHAIADYRRRPLPWRDQLDGGRHRRHRRSGVRARPPDRISSRSTRSSAKSSSCAGPSTRSPSRSRDCRPNTRI